MTQPDAPEQPSRPAWRTAWHRWLLGPATTFRNANRTWLYLGFLTLFLLLMTAQWWRG